MYVSVAAILLGELLIARTAALALYGAGWLALVNLFVIGYEEPALRRQFGPSYERYTKTVGRWIPRLPRGE
jgi:protein-S-isoprenylcysteine O-methyltransferase Ste14